MLLRMFAKSWRPVGIVERNPLVPGMESVVNLSPCMTRCSLKDLGAVQCSVLCSGGSGAMAFASPRVGLRCSLRRVLVRAVEEEGKGQEASIVEEGKEEGGKEEGEKVWGSSPEEAAEWEKLKDRFARTLENLKAVQEMYKKDVDFWGVGTSPVFTVIQDAQERVVSVKINEDEIFRRCGLEPMLPQLDDAEGRVEADLKLARANVMAREMELGLWDPPKGSTLFEFKKEDGGEGSRRVRESAGGNGLLSIVGRAGELVRRTPPLVKQTFFGFLFVYAFFLVWGARILVDDELQKEKDGLKEREADLMKMRKMKARSRKDEVDGNSSPGEVGEGGARSALDPPVVGMQGGSNAQGLDRFRPSIRSDELRKKVEHIQEMARQVRLSEKEVGERIDEAAVELKPSGNGRSSRSPAERLASANGSAGGVVKNVESTVDDETTDLGQALSGGDLKNLADRLSEVQRLGSQSSWSSFGKMDLDPATVDVEGESLDVVAELSVGGLMEQGSVVYVEDSGNSGGEEKGEPLNAGSPGQSSNGAIVGRLTVNKDDECAQHSFFQQADNSSFESGQQVQPEAQNFAPAAKTGNGRNGRHPAENPVFPAAASKVSGFRSAARGSRPKVITSAEEARARIAAKKVKLDETRSSASISGPGTDELANSISSSKEITRPEADGAVAQQAQDSTSSVDGEIRRNGAGTKEREMVEKTPFAEDSTDSGIGDRVSRLDTLLDSVLGDLLKTTERLQGPSTSQGSGPAVCTDQQEQSPAGGPMEGQENGLSMPSQEEREEQEWMRDDVLRQIVFKVQKNEKAGREPFEGLDSEAEALFFRGLERKFEREGEVVKKWIEERVENVDYGLGPIGVDDPPEKSVLRWKDQTRPRSALAARLSEERSRILLDKADMEEGSSSSSSPAADSLSQELATHDRSNATVKPEDKGGDAVRTASKQPPLAGTGEKLGNAGQMKASRTANVSPGQMKASRTANVSPGDPAPSMPSGVRKSVITAGGRRHKVEDQDPKATKKWSRDLQRKYDMEKDPEVKALMKEVGQDLDRWITEEEIHRAQMLLSRGLEGQKQYAEEAYEKVKEKIKKQSETFGPEAMVAKYSEYKPPKEDGLWWLDLPYVVCIGMLRATDGEVDNGIYSLDMAAGFDDSGEAKQRPHTIAFQDRTEAAQFLYLMKAQTYSKVEAAELIPIAPKDLYRDAKSEGFRVTVLKKGQLQLTPGQAFEDVEDKILQIGSSVYWDELVRERSIDMNAVLEDGFGYGRPPSL